MLYLKNSQEQASWWNKELKEYQINICIESVVCTLYWKIHSIYYTRLTILCITINILPSTVISSLVSSEVGDFSDSVMTLKSLFSASDVFSRIIVI